MQINNKVIIITSTFNQLEDTKALFKSIEKQLYSKVKVIIVDDGSTDGTEDYIRKNYKDVILLKGKGNLWWTGSIYVGVEESIKNTNPGDFVLTINNDCIFDEDYILNLLGTSKQYPRSIIGSLIIDSKDKNHIIDAGVRLDWRKGIAVSIGPSKISMLPKGKRVQKNIDTLSTKGTLYPIEVFKKVGNFDKKHLPHYISDYEFACRAKKAGFNLLLSYEAKIYNDVSRTGIGEKLSQSQNIKEIFKLLFSRRSKINIIDHFWFVTLCCPVKYKFINYLRIFLKSLYLFSFVYPINNLRPLVLKFKPKI